MAKEKNYFWEFFVIAIVVGIVLGFVVNGAITGLAAQGISTAKAISDSDNGRDYSLAGECVTSTGAVYADKCKTSSTILEYYIHPYSKLCISLSYNCKLGGYGGCVNGECVSQAEFDVYQKMIDIVGTA